MNRSVADRRKSLQQAAPDPQLTLAGLRAMYEAGGGQAISCTITGHYRTQIFEFPGVHFQGECDDPPQSAYDSASIQATVVTDIRDYFLKRSPSKHYALSPPLRHEVSETDEKLCSQTKGRTRVYLVVEEQNTLSPVSMTNGECSIFDEVQERDGKMIANLVGGREGKTFITAWHAVGGSWPTIPDNQDLAEMILAAVRAGQDSSEPIRRYIDKSCLITDDGRFVRGLCRKVPKPPVTPSALSCNLSVSQEDTGMAHKAPGKSFREGISLVQIFRMFPIPQPKRRPE